MILRMFAYVVVGILAVRHWQEIKQIILVPLRLILHIVERS